MKNFFQRIWNNLSTHQKQVNFFGVVTLFLVFIVFSFELPIETWDLYLSFGMVTAWCVFHVYFNYEKEIKQSSSTQISTRFVASFLAMFIAFGITPETPTYLSIGVFSIWAASRLIKYTQLLFLNVIPKKDKIGASLVLILNLGFASSLFKMTFLGY